MWGFSVISWQMLDFTNSTTLTILVTIIALSLQILSNIRICSIHQKLKEMVCILVGWAWHRKCHKLGSLKQRHSFSHNLEGQKSKMKMLVVVIVSESSQTCRGSSHHVLTWSFLCVFKSLEVLFCVQIFFFFFFFIKTPSYWIRIHFIYIF